MKLGYIGYGEAAYAMSCGVAELKLPDLVQAACSRTFSYKGKPEDAGVIRCSSYEEMAALCDTIFCMTPNTAAVPTARAMAPFLKPGQLYADLSSAAPKLMEEAAEIIEKSGALFADAAMLDGLPKFRNKVNIVVSGTGADEFLKRTAAFLPNVEKVGEKPGEASAIKMLRSLYTKAHLAIAFDMIEGAAAYGVEDYVMQSLAETMDGKDFITGMNGRISGGIIHAARRADELEMAAGMLEDAGLDPGLTLAAAEKLRDIGRLDLKNKITGERPKTWKGALEWIKKVRP
ncbi:MAG: NAD(P)-dependent oxidoreductase [Lachnospiraceae bacterium]|nr:NAD(P)-dependent oxidoreductase [Lachnospiraceae bacterium]